MSMAAGVLRRYPPDQMHRAVGMVTLEAGAHDLLIEYQQEAGAYALDVRWSPTADRRDRLPNTISRTPSADAVRLAQRAAWHGWTVTVLWVALLLTAIGVATRRRKDSCRSTRWPQPGAFWPIRAVAS